MTTLVITPKRLDVLVALKQKQELTISESILELKGCEDASKSFRDYFYNLPESLTSGLGFKRNERCIRAIETMVIPNEWLEAEQDKLGKFDFTY